MSTRADDAFTGEETGPLNADILYLGNGVDILTYDPFSGTPPTKDPVVDLAACPIHVIDRAPTLHAETLTRRGYAEFTRRLAVEAGLQVAFGAFSGSLDSQFTSTAKSIVDTFFARVQATCTSRMLSIGENVHVLTGHLTAQFAEALDTATAEEILDSFGTHVAVKVEYGGRCSYLVSSTATAELDEQQFEARASAKYAAVSGKVGVGIASSRTIEAAEESTKLLVVGGDATTIVPDRLDGLAGWVASVPGRPGFLGFTADGLVPIWTLAGKRREELLVAFRRRAALRPIVRVFQRTSASAEWPHAEVSVPEDYTLLGGGAKVNWAVPGNHLVDSYPSSDDTWIARSRSHWKSSPATITAYAVGLYNPAGWDLWEAQPFAQKGTASEFPSATVTVPEGFTLVGGGAHDNTLSGPGNLLISSYPDAEQKGRWNAAGHDHTRASSGEVTAYAIGLRCMVPGVSVAQVILPSQPSPQEAWPTATQPMKRGYRLVGGGARSESSGTGQLLTASYPEESTDSWVASSKDHLVSDPGRVTAYAVGIRVTAA